MTVVVGLQWWILSSTVGWFHLGCCHALQQVELRNQWRQWGEKSVLVQIQLANNCLVELEGCSDSGDPWVDLVHYKRLSQTCVHELEVLFKRWCILIKGYSTHGKRYQQESKWHGWYPHHTIENTAFSMVSSLPNNSTTRLPSAPCQTPCGGWWALMVKLGPLLTITRCWCFGISPRSGDAIAPYD